MQGRYGFRFGFLWGFLQGVPFRVGEVEGHFLFRRSVLVSHFYVTGGFGDDAGDSSFLSILVDDCLIDGNHFLVAEFIVLPPRLRLFINYIAKIQVLFEMCNILHGYCLCFSI